MRGSFFLFCAALLWGISFLPQKHSTDSLGPLWACAFRFLLAAPLALTIARKRISTLKTHEKKGAVVLGVLLCGAFALQTAGLATSDISRVSLITGLYAAFVPIFAPLFGLPLPRPLAILGLIVGLVGMAFLIGGDGSVDISDSSSWGDVLTFVAALFTAFHVLTMARVAPQADGWAINALQICVMLVLMFPLAFIVEGPPNISAAPSETWWSLIFLAFFSSTVAFALQAIGQKSSSAPTASMIMLLEAPFACIFAMTLADEVLADLQVVGAVLLFCGVFLSVIADLRTHGRTDA